jgi:Lectin C-type domain
MWQRARRASDSCPAFAGWLALAALAGCDPRIGDGSPGSGADSGPADPGPADAAGGTGSEPDAAAASPDAGPPDARPPCAEGDDRIEDPATGACYIFFASGLPWAEAEAACASLGGHLAAIASSTENAFLSQIAPARPPLQDIWIGASDEASEDDFRWSSGDAFGFTAWRRGEPNNGGGDGDVENCAVIEGDNNQPGAGCLWDDRPCADPQPYMCERP